MVRTAHWIMGVFLICAKGGKELAWDNGRRPSSVKSAMLDCSHPNKAPICEGQGYSVPLIVTMFPIQQSSTATICGSNILRTSHLLWGVLAGRWVLGGTVGELLSVACPCRGASRGGSRAQLQREGDVIRWWGEEAGCPRTAGQSDADTQEVVLHVTTEILFTDPSAKDVPQPDLSLPLSLEAAPPLPVAVPPPPASLCLPNVSTCPQPADPPELELFIPTTTSGT
ncbi:hypothetical protein SKAU_G00318520 [Synaphobranchus kaupii]|uniref:Uncharacterized protein n=1 Tax=Synaphobranchus kaupii TaxID=118154 RepID=A0A9Q1ETB0_SYNKA|nr:hypothetical protein SKAU_G00318520 [Synaphobranchus kaupii]